MKEHEIPGHVTVSEGQGGLAKLTLETDCSIAEIYLHGAHVTRFEKKGEAPVLFLSEESEYAAGKAIRGGVPLIFPWFGGREGYPSHGFARTSEWSLEETSVCDHAGVTARLRLPSEGHLTVEYVVRLTDRLSMELAVTNGGIEDATFETCFHTYFQIGTIETVSIRGLKGCSFTDQLRASDFTEEEESIRFSSEVDRIYYHTKDVVEIVDPELHRAIRIDKCGSNSTVVWNPWIAKSQRMPDFGDLEYLRMVCVESGNIGRDKITLSSASRAVLKVTISSRSID